MDKVALNKQIVKQILLEDSKIATLANPNIRRQLITDDERGHYLMYHIGWLDDYKRQYGCFIHLEIDEEGKVWIQHDGTDNPIALRLVEQGIPKEDIVFGFHAPHKRAYSGFAAVDY
ncbi:MAG: XisI protein [Bacteroidota bacterium]